MGNNVFWMNMELWLKANLRYNCKNITISVELIYSLFSPVKQSHFRTEFFTWMHGACKGKQEI